MQSGAEAGPFRRRVFYIPGYDPFHPRRYRELYRREGAEQARLSGYRLDVAPWSGAQGFGWRTKAVIGGRASETWVEVLTWADLVQESMSSSLLRTYAGALRLSGLWLFSGAFGRLIRLRKGPVIAACYPLLLLMLQLVFALGAAGFLAKALGLYLPLPFALAAGLALAFALLRWFRARDGKIFAWYLVHDFAYSASCNGAYPAALEARLAAFRAQIRIALAGEYDEVLLVGHSSGAHLGVSVLADLLREGLPRPGAGRKPPALSFLSLGQVVPMVSYLPQAQRLRGDLLALCDRPDLTWIDVSAPGDGCSFALCDPVAVSVAAPEGRKWPLVLSAAFSQTLSPERWKALKRRWFRLHFQYLCAFDNLPGQRGDYDYFRVTAGPLTLWQRFGDRRPSQSRIVEMHNKFTDLA